MKKITFFYYREWAREILKDIIRLQSIRKDFEIEAIVTLDSIVEQETQALDKQNLIGINPENPSILMDLLGKNESELIFFYGWSWYVPPTVIENFICLCLHPSKLPQFRGGSPIQNQVLNGVTDSAVSVIRMSKIFDAGPLYKQESLSLTGTIDEILIRMTSLGRSITESLISDYLNNDLKFFPQPKDGGSLVKRRKPSDGTFTIEDIRNKTFEDFSQHVKLLRFPYPNVTIKFKEKLIYVRDLHKFSTLPDDAFLLVGNDTSVLLEDETFFIQLRDSYALISDWSFTINEGE